MPKSPKILSHSWGRMEVEEFGSGRDFKLWPGGCAPWDWRETGTGHFKGIQKADVKELIDGGCEVIVIGRGVFSRLRVPASLVRFLEDRGIEVLAADTKTSIQLYNEKADQGAMVGGLFHTTC